MAAPGRKLMTMLGLAVGPLEDPPELDAALCRQVAFTMQAAAAAMPAGTAAPAAA